MIWINFRRGLIPECSRVYVWTKIAVASDGTVEFLIVSMTHWASPARTWLVCRGSLSNCVGIQDDLASAVAQGLRMATYIDSCGQLAQVHMQASPDAPWHTVWHSQKVSPRYAPISSAADTVAPG